MVTWVILEEILIALQDSLISAFSHNETMSAICCRFLLNLTIFTCACSQSLVDLSGVYRVWNSKYKTWSVFGQDHLAKVLLGWDSQNASHDAVGDAIKSIRLFNLYNTLKAYPKAWQQAQVSLLPCLTQQSLIEQGNRDQ